MELALTHFRETGAAMSIPLGLSPFLEPPKPKTATKDQDRSLRRGQVGALHAISQHFLMGNTSPAVVVMPTGSGKTGVMQASCYVLGPKRVLVVTPSRLVRSQIASKFADPSTLWRLGLIDQPLNHPPTVHEVVKRIGTLEDWETLAEYDVVISTVNSASSGHHGVADPPSDLFDLILVDEAHHSAARTWNVLLQQFPAAKRILFTATPFRRDSQQLAGDIAFVYSARQAFEDEIFGKIEYVPVSANSNATPDEGDALLAKHTEEVFRGDRERGLQHSVIVRVDGMDRADQLAEIYEQHTSLKLKTVHSGLSYRTIQRTIASLTQQDLDGVICVNMMGEGFDFPNLKIAAIHSPHRSLAVTLQFIGRFARTNDPKIGSAKFLAFPNEIKLESELLYQEESAWEEIVPDLLDKVVQQVVSTEEKIRSFEPVGADRTAIADLSLYSLVPYFHAKIYRTTADVKLDADLSLGRDTEIVLRRKSERLNTIVFVSKDRFRPEWLNTGLLETVTHDLTVIFWDATHELLFVCSTLRRETYYDTVSQQLAPGNVWPLVHNEIKRATLDLTNLEFFNVGMRNRIYNNTSESYRILSGPTPTNGIRESDGMKYHQGHVFGKGLENGQEVTIGLSSLSKVWSNTSGRIDSLVEWCSKLGDRISRDEVVNTSTYLDRLGTGERAMEIPEHPLAAIWDKYFYENPCRLQHVSADGELSDEWQLLDSDWVFELDQCDKQKLVLSLESDDFAFPLEFRLDRRPHLTPADPGLGKLLVRRGVKDQNFIEVMNAKPLRFYFSDLSSLSGSELLRSTERTDLTFDFEHFEEIDWATGNVDIEREFGQGRNGKSSIHDYLTATLHADGSEVVFYDHGSGEVADVISVKDTGEMVEFSLFHCKGSGGKQSGARVGDAYEVCSQAVKSSRWMGHHKRLREKMKARTRRKYASEFIVGNFDTYDDLVSRAMQRGSRFKFYAVQPGLSRASCESRDDLCRVLAMAKEYILDANGDYFGIWGSS